jgi:hypothetical protein
MRIIVFITDPPTVRDILIHLGEPITPPTIVPARGPPLWAAAAVAPAPLDSIPSEAFGEFHERRAHKARKLT